MLPTTEAIDATSGTTTFFLSIYLIFHIPLCDLVERVDLGGEFEELGMKVGTVREMGCSLAQWWWTRISQDLL